MALSELTGLTNQDFALIGTGIGAVLATFITTWRGLRRKTPVPPIPPIAQRHAEDALAAEIASLRSDHARTATQLAQQLDEIERRNGGLRDLLIEIRAKM
ncbi:MAG: hypothetical protein CML02_02520 [Pseudooceanicola sp.]|mgnify:CR=1 FL=1|nr:hypothetical protein [Pseudooceanicola sp.]